MVRKFYNVIIFILSFSLLTGCSKEVLLEKYNDSNGVFVLNSSSPSGNASLTYIYPDGKIKTNIYKEVNGAELGRNARALSVHGGKMYILCDSEDDVLIICDAATLKKEKSFKMSDFKFDIPEGVNDTYGIGFRNPANISVIDEHNVFIVDTQGLFRFDCVTGELFLLEGSYALGNSGRTIETGVGNKSLPIVNGRLYAATGGFWKPTGVLEYEKGKNVVSRKIEISTKIKQNSGLVKDSEGQLWLTTYNRADKSKSELHLIDTKGSELTSLSPVTVRGCFDPGFENTPGVSIANNYAYFCGQTTTISRSDMEVNKTKANYVDVTLDEGKAVYMSCNPVVNSLTNYLYVATCDTKMEGKQSNNNLLIYDCNNDSPTLLYNYSEGTYSVSGIYFVSNFYK